MRHTPLKEMDDEGWVPLPVICEKLGVTAEIVAKLFMADMKGRYQYCLETGRLRALFGHSVHLMSPAWRENPISLDDLDEFPLETQLMHATTDELWRQIQSDGFLRPMNRMAIHFALDKKHVRRRPVLLTLDLQKALELGVELYRANANIIVCPNTIPISMLVASHC